MFDPLTIETLEHDSTAGEASPSVSRALPWIIIGWGVLLRVVPYFANRSLWLDEAMLAPSILHRSFLGLLKPLEYDQGAPFGFLVLEKLAVECFGNNEYALRFFPVVFGILSLFLFYRLAKLCLTGLAVPVAVGFFSISGPLVYYSSETKQYSTDVGIALLLFLLAVNWKSRDLTPPRIAGFGAIGAAALWFSHPAAFVLAGIGATFLAFSFFDKQRQGIQKVALLCSLWALSFAASYEISLRPLGLNSRLLYDWTPCYVPSPLLSFKTANWLDTMSFGNFLNPAGFELTGLAAFAFLVGCFSMFRDRREQLFISISPIAFTLLAAGIHKYPFCGRVLIFLVPTLVLLVAAGVECIRREDWSGNLIGFLLIALLSFGPLLFSTYQVVRPHSPLLPLGVDRSQLPLALAGGGHTKEEMKPVLSYLKANEREGDTIYVFDGAKPAFLYYAPKYGLDKTNYVLGAAASGTNNWKDYADDIDRLPERPRVWFLFSHLHEQRNFLLYLLDERGTRRDSFQTVGAEVYLYDFSHPGSLAPR